MKTTIEAWDLEIEVDHDPYPAQNGGRTDPSWPSGTDINFAVSTQYPEVDLSEMISDIPGGWIRVEELMSEAEAEY
jgi:hypothetical protein